MLIGQMIFPIHVHVDKSTTNFTFAFAFVILKVINLEIILFHFALIFQGVFSVFSVCVSICFQGVSGCFQGVLRVFSGCFKKLVKALGGKNEVLKTC